MNKPQSAETKVLRTLLDWLGDRDEEERCPSLKDMMRNARKATAQYIPFGAFDEAERLIWAAFAATPKSLWVPKPKASPLSYSLLIDKIWVRAWKVWMMYEVIYAAFIASSMLDDSLPTLDSLPAEDSVESKVKRWLTVVEKIEYSSEGYIKRYPDEKELKAVIEEMRKVAG